MFKIDLLTLEHNASLKWLEVQDRFAIRLEGFQMRFSEWLQAEREYRDFVKVVGKDWCRQESRRLMQEAMFYMSQERRNLTPLGCWLILQWQQVQFNLETAYYIITGKQPKSWQAELCRQADEELLSHAR